MCINTWSTLPYLFREVHADLHSSITCFERTAISCPKNLCHCKAVKMHKHHKSWGFNEIYLEIMCTGTSCKLRVLFFCGINSWLWSKANRMVSATSPCNIEGKLGTFQFWNLFLKCNNLLHIFKQMSEKKIMNI